METREQRLTRMTARERWLVGNIDELKRSMTRAPWLALGLLAVPVVGWRWGFAAAALVAFTVITLVCVALYVAWSHRQEYEGELFELRGKLKSLEADGGRVPTKE
ncbi:MAG: hypothetical protein JWM10_2602 [Myxococcaceae bacterium]|nr:hypothetical protein [Myxococcaceae bacterium]